MPYSKINSDGDGLELSEDKSSVSANSTRGQPIEPESPIQKAIMKISENKVKGSSKTLSKNLINLNECDSTSQLSYVPKISIEAPERKDSTKSGTNRKQVQKKNSSLLSVTRQKGGRLSDNLLSQLEIPGVTSGGPRKKKQSSTNMLPKQDLSMYLADPISPFGLSQRSSQSLSPMKKRNLLNESLSQSSSSAKSKRTAQSKAVKRY